MADYSPKYLVFVAADANHNKFYRMTPKGDRLLVEYGRVGCENVRTMEYDIREFDKLYRSKVKKGYQDKTNLVKDLIVEDANDTGSLLQIADRSVNEIVTRLQKFANKCVTENYTISSNQVTKAMCDEAQRILDNLVTVNDVKTFNKQLEVLFTTIPRKMKNVKDHLITRCDQIAKTIDREQSILDTMRGQVISTVPKKTTDNKVKSDILEALGLEIRDVTTDEQQAILDHLGATLRPKFKKAWRVVNKKTQAEYDKFLKEYNITNTKLYFHGSRNENWWSILQNGLVLRPTNAIITGAMFGAPAIYFANRAIKSYGYTSGRGSYWASGISTTAFMAIMDVAEGIPYDVYHHTSEYYSYNYEVFSKKHPGCHSLFAHGGIDLRNDEIIVYRAEQATIHYLIELNA